MTNKRLVKHLRTWIQLKLFSGTDVTNFDLEAFMSVGAIEDAARR